MKVLEVLKKIFDKDILYLIINIIFFLNFILSIIFLNPVISDSSENPLEKETYFDKNYYFVNETNIINVPGSNNSKENNMNECYQIQSLILSNNQSLSSIFEFKTDTIHTLSVTLKAFDIIMLFCVIFMFLSFPFPHKNDDTNCLGSLCSSLCDEICFRCIYMPFLILYILSFIVQIIVFSISCGKYNNSDTSNFLNFLECHNINKEAFEEYSIVNDYSYHFGLLKIFHSIYIVYCLIFIPLTYFIYYVYDYDISSSKETTNDTKNEKEETNDKTQIILDN